jgi:hypothetical protein
MEFPHKYNFFGWMTISIEEDGKKFGYERRGNSTGSPISYS